MERTSLQEFTELLAYLREKEIPTLLRLPGTTPDVCRDALKDWLAEKDADAVWLPVPDGDGEAAVGVRDPENAPLLPALAGLFERALSEYRENASDDGARDLYRRSLQYIKEHYMEGITVADIAREIGYSSSYFGYIFKKKHGIPVNQYVRQLQLAKAKDLLKNTSFSVSMVAEYVGYEDANYFSSLFKAQFGLSPKQYRSEHNHLV